VKKREWRCRFITCRRREGRRRIFCKKEKGKTIAKRATPNAEGLGKKKDQKTTHAETHEAPEEAKLGSDLHTTHALKRTRHQSEKVKGSTKGRVQNGKLLRKRGYNDSKPAAHDAHAPTHSPKPASRQKHVQGSSDTGNVVREPKTAFGPNRATGPRKFELKAPSPLRPPERVARHDELNQSRLQIGPPLSERPALPPHPLTRRPSRADSRRSMGAPAGRQIFTNLSLAPTRSPRCRRRADAQLSKGRHQAGTDLRRLR
jgi:hypothetical protein